jgi:methyl coenzyme M reductase beta subunit
MFVKDVCRLVHIKLKDVKGKLTINSVGGSSIAGGEMQLSFEHRLEHSCC